MDPRDRTFSEVHTTRRSVREYTGELVATELVRDIVEEAAHAPSAFNGQPWRVVVVRGDELGRVLGPMGGNATKVESAGTLVAVFADTAELGEHADYYDGRPGRSVGEWAARNGSLFAMSLMDVAWSHGVATRPMIGFDAEALAEALGVPDSWHPVIVTTLGWPADVELGPRQRRPVDEILTVIG